MRFFMNEEPYDPRPAVAATRREQGREAETTARIDALDIMPLELLAQRVLRAGVLAKNEETRRVGDR